MLSFSRIFQEFRTISFKWFQMFLLVTKCIPNSQETCSESFSQLLNARGCSPSSVANPSYRSFQGSLKEISIQCQNTDKIHEIHAQMINSITFLRPSNFHKSVSSSRAGRSGERTSALWFSVSRFVLVQLVRFLKVVLLLLSGFQSQKRPEVLDKFRLQTQDLGRRSRIHQGKGGGSIFLDRWNKPLSLHFC